MKLSKRQQKKVNNGRSGQLSRPRRRAAKRLEIATSAYNIAQSAPGTSGEKKRSSSRKPGAQTQW